MALKIDDLSPRELELLTKIAEPYADRTSILMKTTYRDVGVDTRFLVAFEDAVGKNAEGEHKYLIKQMVGRILGRRPKNTAKKNDSFYPTIPRPTMIFVVDEAVGNLVILKTTIMGERMAYCRNEHGEVVCTAHSANLKQIAETYGLSKAKEVFERMDVTAIQSGSITLGERSADLITMTIGDKWKICLCRGKKNVIAQASEIASGKPIKQNQIPGSLLKEARGIAVWWLTRDTKTQSLIPQ